jgi:mevalonate kinase
MTAIAATAPGKIILFGEHAVVYGRPAIAVPVNQVRAKAVVLANPIGQPGQVDIDAPDIGLQTSLDDLPDDHPLKLAIREVQERLDIQRLPALRLLLTSTIPIASGLGSGAAVSVAISRAVSAFLGKPLSNEDVSAIAYRVDQTYHGNPSGIDNTVITYAQSIFFVRGRPFDHLKIKYPFTIVIGDSGMRSPTGLVVGDLRLRWQAEPQLYEPIFDQIGEIVLKARTILETGLPKELGSLITQNQALLQQLDVSCPELNRLVQTALDAGAHGAKLCGGGRGGNMIALVEEQNARRVAAALQAAGASNTIITRIS